MGFEAARIPDGWAHTTLDAVCQILDARRVPVNSSERSLRIAGKSADNLYPYYGATGQVGVIDDFIFDGEHILLGEDGAPFLDPFKVKSYLVGGKFWVNNHAHILRSTVSNKYICHYFNQIDYSDHVTGTTRLKLTQDALRRIPVPVAPATEQHRIVAKIEGLFSELDKGIESLKTAQAQLKAYRQAVLKHAFEGRLTARWREENQDRLETPEQLLARIKQERAARYEQQLQEWGVAVKIWEESGGLVGKAPPKPQKPKNLPNAEVSSTDNSLWTHLRLHELAAESVLGKMLDKEKNTGTARHYLGNINLRWGKFDLDDLKTMKMEDNEIDRYCLAEGDLVICEGGEPGRCAVWEGQEPTMLIQKALHRLRFTQSYSPYFAFYFMVYAAQAGLLSPNLTGSTIKHLTGKGLGNVLFPLCALEEQEQIVRYLDSIFALCERLDCQISNELIKAEGLRQAILKKAFTGQLVPQDPHDEPAPLLLERIKAEKAAQGQNNTRARRRRTAATA